MNGMSRPTTWGAEPVRQRANARRNIGNFFGDFFAMLAPGLIAAALVDWLVTRTLTRFAIFIPKTPEMIIGYQWLNWSGQVGSTVAAFLALLGVSAMAVIEWRTRQTWWLALPIVGLVIMAGSAPFLPPAIGLPGYFLFAIMALVALSWRIVRMATPATVRLAALLPVLAMIAATLYQAAPTLYALLHWPGPPAWGLPLFRVGDGLVVSGAAALWWALGRCADRRSWLAGCLLASLFAAAYLAAPAMTATLVVWSHGLTLSLPWPFYAMALWLYGVTIIESWRTGQRYIVYALLLLLAAGYTPQLSSQLWFGLIALWLLTEGSSFQTEVKFMKYSLHASRPSDLLPRLKIWLFP
jgi:hypothetical protein